MGTTSNALLDSCVPIAVGVLFLCGALYWWRRGRELRDHGVTSQATVVAKHRQRFGSVFVMEFTDPDGELRKVEIRTYSNRGGMINQGSTIPITYVPDRPETARLGLKWGVYIESGLALFVAVFGGGLVVHRLYLLFGLLTGRLKPGDL
jgi:hypothetical protein